MHVCNNGDPPTIKEVHVHADRQSDSCPSEPGSACVKTGKAPTWPGACDYHASVKGSVPYTTCTSLHSFAF